MLVLYKFSNYAVGLIYPDLRDYGIIANTKEDYDKLVFEGAYLEVAIDEIQSPSNILYSYVARCIYENQSLRCKVFKSDQTGVFVFAVSSYD